MVEIVPIYDHLVVKLEEEEEKTKSGIVLPDTAKEKPQKGKVIAVGSGRILDNGQKVTPEVHVGDTVVFSKYSGTELKLDGEKYLILTESDVLAILKK
ncbi:MAG: co-chaperone GroES [Caldiserica bacterium CG02_land_8_20_14_3_00_36_38]|nr:co-chaperone GroES [Caldisericota bacterium]OIP12292.1 MAG: co-chaperone GroES [Caldisericum sp. CG2_30_36_11]PIP49975.1 MAG: co-chaperone GroES [Caldiserica bacterium CG23_combo_of_CG06-09_8_20_14_all_35_60]PIV54605.1 MAG: co-chaperone GroES [Caldiserica bacterium CG02_land_8_20_14_3_00_36_38]PIX29555.1 MAG: co-chaperone GroES [Caldiserica bacterium CG_4_8_14_3_um_filter_35_18]